MFNVLYIPHFIIVSNLHACTCVYASGVTYEYEEKQQISLVDAMDSVAYEAFIKRVEAVYLELASQKGAEIEPQDKDNLDSEV